MNFDDLLKIENLNVKEFRLVRHGYKEIDPLAIFRDEPGLFDAYQAFQQIRKFGNAKYLAVFAPYHSTQALFLGVWKIEKEMPALEAPKRMRKQVEQFGWDLSRDSYYMLKQVDNLSDLSERLVIEWGGSTVSWVQKKSNKPVIIILPPAHIQEFKSYDQVVIDREQLVKMIANPTYNATWYNALRSVNGIYCISDKRNGKLYVGSAYGKNGIWGRWNEYITTGHGGNKKLLELLSDTPDAVNHFQYTILEILPGSCTADDAIAKEALWKRKLCSRDHGYNDN
ncbi:MAG: GIY-YIG nuclease family protein [Candidatus Thiodiazotropha lotti]|nr:GIY-YIG nuclease family protein [Candidatus Thiodiazotropha lotti]